jgi:two-component system sensor histidine kinase/response regulator
MSYVLIVDDDLTNFDVIELLLSGEGYDLSYAASGREALNILESNQPDVILLDLLMPELDGIEVCRQIKSNPSWRHIPIIMVTSLNSKEDLARCIEAGADDFIGKPVSFLELRSRVRSMLRIKKHYDELQLALNSLKAALQLREDMSHMVVHDMRNPLTNILASSQLMLLTALEEKHRQHLEKIHTSGQQLLSLTDDLLMLAKVEAGKLTLNRIDVDISYLAKRVMSDFQDIAQQKNIQLVSDLPEPGTWILVDVNLFRRVLDNLLSNALKFSQPCSQILVRVDYPVGQETQARIRISDQGAGISEELHQRIFEKYEVGDVASEVSQIGLGLAFCKMVIEAHGGKIFVESNHPQGSVFTVVI